MDMINIDNAQQISNNIGRCIEVDQEPHMQNRSFLKIKIEVNMDNPLMELSGEQTHVKKKSGCQVRLNDCPISVLDAGD